MIATPERAPRTCHTHTHSGLRLRLGFHAGLHSAAEVNLNAATGRAAYSGVFMAMAREVSNAGPGGCVMMSEAARRRLAAAVSMDGCGAAGQRGCGVAGLRGSRAAG
jgi:hypothetical protein